MKISIWKAEGNILRCEQVGDDNADGFLDNLTRIFTAETLKAMGASDDDLAKFPALQGDEWDYAGWLKMRAGMSTTSTGQPADKTAENLPLMVTEFHHGLWSTWVYGDPI